MFCNYSSSDKEERSVFISQVGHWSIDISPFLQKRRYALVSYYAHLLRFIFATFCWVFVLQHDISILSGAYFYELRRYMLECVGKVMLLCGGVLYCQWMGIV